MRILHVDSGREMRGGQWQALFLIEGLKRRGHDCILLAQERSPLFAEAAARGIDVRTLSHVSVWLVSRTVEVTHAHDARAHSLAAVWSGTPVVVSRRVAFEVRTGRLSRWKYRRAKHYIAVSEYVKDKLLAAGVDPGRISVIYDAVPEMEARTSAEAVVAPASDDPMKGSDLVLRAGAVGGWAPIFSKSLRDDLRHAAVFVYISRNEGLGSAALLAMAAGVPVVASRIGGLTEIVREGETGLLVENTPEAIAAGVNLVLYDPALGARLGDSARRLVEECFSVDSMVEKSLEVYERVKKRVRR